MADEKNDLSWLNEVKPVKTEMVQTKRGRQPGDNPLAAHVKNSHDSGDTLTIPVPAASAKRVERLMRRAATNQGWSISVQVLKADPAKGATSDDVVALKDVADLPEGSDVWVSFLAKDPEPKSEPKSETSTEDASATDDGDPFAGSPDAEPEEAEKPAPRGRKRTAA